MSDRLIARCATCGESVDLPNQGLGRATLAAWRTQHQGHDVTEGEGA